MKASRRKGVATHPDPESFVASRKATIEALTGAHVGRALSCEIICVFAKRPSARQSAPIGGSSARSVTAILDGTRSELNAETRLLTRAAPLTWLSCAVLYRT
jgi:hypothetical protein